MVPRRAPAGPDLGPLASWRRPIAVVAHPDDESFGLGAVLDVLARGGAQVGVLCLTHGEASSLHGVDGDLHALRGRELGLAADALGAGWVRLLDHPDGGLAAVDPERLVADVLSAADTTAADGVVVFDRSGVTGHPDHTAATCAALAAAAYRGVPVAEWTLPASVAATLNTDLGTSFHGHRPHEIDMVLRVDRRRQRVAIAAHGSQAVPGSPLWRRLEMLGDREYLRLTPAARQERTA